MKLRPIKNKRAGYTDIYIWIILTVVIVFIFGAFIYMGTNIENELQTKFKEHDRENKSTVNYTETLKETFHPVNVALSSLYWLSFFLIIGLIIAIMAGAYLVQSKPIYFVPYIFIIIIAIILAAEISNAYEDKILTQEDIGSTYQKFTGTNFILSYFPIWVAVVGLLGGIIMFAKLKHAEEYPY